MLKILCCVKQVPDVDQMRMDPETETSSAQVSRRYSTLRTQTPSPRPSRSRSSTAPRSPSSRWDPRTPRLRCVNASQSARTRPCSSPTAPSATPTLATSYSIMSAAATQGSYDMIFCGKGISRRRDRTDGRTACPALRRGSGHLYSPHQGSERRGQDRRSRARA